MSARYLEAVRVALETAAPAFVEPGHCYWCNGELRGRQTKYCSDRCSLAFSNYFYSRPAYVRATFIRDNFTCQECGLHPMRKDKPWLPDISQLECDHIIPLARGGETKMSNLQTLCSKCNRKKGISVSGEPVQDLPPVIPSRDKSKCPGCRAYGYRVLPWQPPEYYDPLMFKVGCLRCRQESYIAPGPWDRRRKSGKTNVMSRR